MNANRLPVPLIALAFVGLLMVSGVMLLSEDSDAALGTFTGGTNRSTESNPYTGIDCDVDDLESSFAFGSYVTYYVELGSSFDITGLDPNNEFHSYDSRHMVLALVDGIWAGKNLRGFFYDTGQTMVGIGEDYVIVFEVVCNNDTKVKSISVSGASSGTYTTGYRPGQENYERDLAIYTTPRYNADPTPTTSVKIEQRSGYDVAKLRHGISASGLVPYLHFTPIGTGTATFRITATDGGGAYTDLTVVVSEYIDGTLTFNANGGSGAPARMEDETYTGTFYYDIPEEIPTRSGYKFLGWSEDRYATEAEYAFDDGVTDLDDRFRTTSRSATLYAVWEQTLTTYHAKLTYDASGGSGAPAEQSSSITASSPSGSKTFVIPSTVPVRTGFEFVGWSAVKDSTTAQYSAGDSVGVAYGSTMTLYAVWQQAKITVSGTPDSHGIVGTSWRYTPVLSTSGCGISVSGADWLVVSGGSVSGTPTSPGEYNVTLTASKSGYVTGTQTFKVIILSNLSFQSSPTGGAIIYAK